MNAPGAGGLLRRYDLLDIQAKLDAIITDEDTRVRVDVLVTLSQTFDTAAGTTAASTVTSPLSGYLGPLATSQATAPYQVGDVVLLIPAADVVGTLDAAATWKTQPAGLVYRVITSTLDALGLHWQLVGRRSS